jgi:hypothetical protein
VYRRPKLSLRLFIFVVLHLGGVETSFPVLLEQDFRNKSGWADGGRFLQSRGKGELYY